jgi:hypothetical protein
MNIEEQQSTEGWQRTFFFLDMDDCLEPSVTVQRSIKCKALMDEKSKTLRGRIADTSLPGNNTTVCHTKVSLQLYYSWAATCTLRNGEKKTASNRNKNVRRNKLATVQQCMPVTDCQPQWIACEPQQVHATKISVTAASSTTREWWPFPCTRMQRQSPDKNERDERETTQ